MNVTPNFLSFPTSNKLDLFKGSTTYLPTISMHLFSTSESDDSCGDLGNLSTVP